LSTEIDQQPKLQIVRDACPLLIRTLPQMRMDPRDPMRIASGSEDHPVITAGYFCQSSIAPSREPMPKVEIPLWQRHTARKPLGSANVRHQVIA
jgi:hypothetical protein